MAGHPAAWEMPTRVFVVIFTEYGSHYDVSVTYNDGTRILLNTTHTYTDYRHFKRLRQNIELMARDKNVLTGSVTVYYVPLRNYLDRSVC